MGPPTSRVLESEGSAFELAAFLTAIRSPRKIVHARKRETIFSAGERSDAMFYIEKGSVKLTVTSKEGREAIVGLCNGGDFLGESSITPEPRVRFYTAVALTDSRLVKIDRMAIITTLRAVSDSFYLFISSMIERNAQFQQDFANSLLDTSERRLARVLLTLARLNEGHKVPLTRISQQDWANMIGVTRQRVNFLLKRFRKSGFIDDAAGLKVNPSLLTVLGEQKAAGLLPS